MGAGADVVAARLTGRNLLLLVGLGALWGTAFMFIAMGLPSFSPILFAALRFDVAGLALLGVALWRKADLRPRSRAQWIAILVAAVLNVGAYHALLFAGQQTISPTVAAVIIGLNPILTTVAARAFLSDERVGWGGVLGLGLGLTGVLVLALTRAGESISLRSLADVFLLDGQQAGMLLALGAIASWSIGSTLVRRTRHGMDVFAFTTWQMLVGALLLHLGALGLEGGGRAVWDAPGVASLLYLALVSSSLGFVVYFTLMERVGPIRSNLVSHVSPVFAAIASFLILDVRLEARALLAFIFIATGFFLVARPAPPRESVSGSGTGS